MTAPDGRAIRAGLLGRQYTQVREQLDGAEVLLAVSMRKPMLFTGLFCIMIGVVFAAQIAVFFLFSHPCWMIPALMFFVILIWTGVRLAFLIGGEYVFVTDKRLIHQKVDLLGRRSGRRLSIQLADISAVRLLRGTVILGSFNSSFNGASGDVLIKNKEGKTYLIPTLKDGAALSEALMAELKRYKS